MHEAYQSLLRRLDSYEVTEPFDRYAQYGYALALYDGEFITLDELEALRERIGLTVEETDNLQV